MRNLRERVLKLVCLFLGAFLAFQLIRFILVGDPAKGLVIPALLRRAMRAAHIDREMEPLIGFVPSLLLGAGGTIAAVALARLLPLLPEHSGSLLVPGSLASVLTGFVLLIGRTKAISQVCGYLILENGIYLFGLLLIHSTTLLVEAGILLDVTVGVFIIGIIVDRIQRAFDSIRRAGFVDVPEHHDRRHEHGSGIRQILSRNVWSCAMHCFEKRSSLSEICAGNHSQSADQTCR